MVNPAKQFANNRDYWETPRDIFDLIQAKFHLDLDVASSHENALCARHYTAEDNALVQPWDGRWWCNPPYSLKEEFLAKAWEEMTRGNYGIMLLPSSQETEWFREYITYPRLRRVVWPKRIQFLLDGKRLTRKSADGKTVNSGNTGGSVIIAFFPDDYDLPDLLSEPWVR